MKIAHAGLGLGGLVLLISGAHLAIGGLFAAQAQLHVERWEAAAQAPPTSHWLAAHHAAQRAVSWYPVAHGDYLDRLGRVESWKAVGQPFEPGYASNIAALGEYRAAIGARPNWPYTWVGLAESKVALRQFDDELDQALTRAFELGPWRLGVNRALSTIGLNAWPQLTPMQRLNTLRSATRTVAFSQIEAHRLMQVARHNGLLAAVCGSLDPQQVKPMPTDCSTDAPQGLGYSGRGR